MNEKLNEKIKESLSSVLPITLIVALVCLFIVPVSTSSLITLFVGSLFLILGMGLFSLGADTSMSLIGERIGASLSKSKKLWVIALVSFLVGTITTIAEPDLNVLATQIPSVPDTLLIITVGIVVGIFLAIAMLRIVFKIKLPVLLFVLYLIVFIISYWVPRDFLPIAFDSGGVTTGPMTVPFILALGIGAASIRNDKDSESDSFGLVALCSIGPILAIMILGIIFRIEGSEFVPFTTIDMDNSKTIGSLFLSELPYYAMEVFEALLPIVVFFVLYNFFSLKLSKQELKKIFVGFIYTFIGLVIFLTGVNVGYLPVGNELGASLVGGLSKTMILPIIMLMGYFVIKAEPVVQVLTKQVSNLTDGMVSEKMMFGTLSVSMMIALMISLFRAWYGISFMFFVLPLYLLAIVMTFFVPEVFVGIAFDSGGVASGPMTASFLLPLMVGVCEASGRADLSVMHDAFGIISLVALMPLVTIQVVGLLYKYRKDTYFKEIDNEYGDNSIVIFPKKKK